MAIDLEAIRKRVAQLSGNYKNSAIQLWKPGVGEYRVRGLAWKNASESSPIIEKWFYYLGNGPGILTPNQFGKPDPIQDLIRKLYSLGKPDDKALAKKLLPKMRAYLPIIVRGEEAKGVQVWSFGKIIYQKLLNYYLDSDVGDILDPESGFDLKIVITQQPGKQFQDTQVDAARKTSVLTSDIELLKKWSESVPNLDDMYKLKSTQEIESLLSQWLSGDVPSTDDGLSKSPVKEKDELDKLVDEIKPAKKSKKSTASEVDVDAPVVENKSIDDAFDELMQDD